MLRAVAVVTLLALSACSSKPEVDASAASWGAALAPADQVLALDELLGNPQAFDGKEVTLTGDVSSVCQSKGCWMVLASGDETVRVTFKDYGFFVPMELTGPITAQGLFTVKTVSEADARHYLEDAGAPQEEIEAIVGEQLELSLEAVGVERAE